MEKVEKDYREFLKLFNKHKVKYCIVGAFAVAYYAIPRFTKDMDIFVEPSILNGRKIVHALEEFGFEALELSAEVFAEEGKIIQLGYEPIRIDLLTAIDGVTFEKVWRNKIKGEYGDERAYFIGLEELIKNKHTAKRKQDKMDIDILLAAKKRVRK